MMFLWRFPQNNDYNFLDKMDYASDCRKLDTLGRVHCLLLIYILFDSSFFIDIYAANLGIRIKFWSFGQVQAFHKLISVNVYCFFDFQPTVINFAFYNDSIHKTNIDRFDYPLKVKLNDWLFVDTFFIEIFILQYL
jgi:hypothetical protein